MIDLGPHAVFIVWAYLGAFGLTFGVIAYVIWDARRVAHKLKALDAQGIRRRSSGTAS